MNPVWKGKGKGKSLLKNLNCNKLSFTEMCSLAVALFALFISYKFFRHSIISFMQNKKKSKYDFFFNEILIKCCILHYGNCICRVGTNTYNFIFEKEKKMKRTKHQHLPFTVKVQQLYPYLLQYLYFLNDVFSQWSIFYLIINEIHSVRKPQSCL